MHWNDDQQHFKETFKPFEGGSKHLKIEDPPENVTFACFYSTEEKVGIFEVDAASLLSFERNIRTQMKSKGTRARGEKRNTASKPEFSRGIPTNLSWLKTH